MISRDRIEAHRRELFATKLDGVANELRLSSFEIGAFLLEGVAAELRGGEPAGFVARICKHLVSIHLVEPYDELQFTRDVLRALATEHRVDRPHVSFFFEGAVEGLRENGEIGEEASPAASIGFEAARLVYTRTVELQREVDAPRKRKKIRRDKALGIYEDPREEAPTTSQRAAQVIDQAALVQENTGIRRQRTRVLPVEDRRELRGPTELLPVPFEEEGEGR
jgi:hypothetical protein